MNSPLSLKAGFWAWALPNQQLLPTDYNRSSYSTIGYPLAHLLPSLIFISIFISRLDLHRSSSDFILHLHGSFSSLLHAYYPCLPFCLQLLPWALLPAPALPVLLFHSSSPSTPGMFAHKCILHCLHKLSLHHCSLWFLCQLLSFKV